MDVLEGIDDVEEQEDIVETIRNNLKDHAAAYREWRRKAKESYDFVSSDQWTDEEKQALQDSARTPIVFNRIARTINAVTGLELQNRQEVTYKPVAIGNAGQSDVMNSAAKWARSNCDAEDEESEAFSDALICGIGGTETLMDYSTNLDGMIVIERMDPFECAADHCSKKRNFDDMRWAARWKGYSKKEFDRMYPGVEPDGAELISWGVENDYVDHVDDEYKHDEDSDKSDDKVYTVVKYQYYEEETVYRVNVNGEIKTLTSAEYEAVGKVLSGQGYECIPQQKRNYKQVVICRDTILEQSECPIDGFTFRFITGLRNRNENTWFGLVELMKDPQRWANKWLSQIQYIINSNAKGGLLYESGAFANPKKAKADWAKPNTWIEVVKGAISEGRIKDRTPPAYPDGVDRLLQQALTAINDVPGVNVEMLGLTNRNQPGMVEDGRKAAGVTNMASFFDALRRYRKEQGRVLKQFILNYISDGRLIRIDGANAQYVPLKREELAQDYDIIVDDAPTSANMKEKTFNALSQMLGVALQAGIPVPPEILQYSPLPAQLVEKWMQTIEQQKSADPEKEIIKGELVKLQEQMKAAVSELEDKSEEIAVKAKGDELKHQADMVMAAIKQYEAETNRIKLNSEVESMKPMAASPEDIALRAKELEIKERELSLKEIEAARNYELRMIELSRSEPKEEDKKEPENDKNTALLASVAQNIQSLLAEQVNAIREQTAAITQPKYASFDANGNITVQ